MLKNRKGISLTTMVITVMVMLIIMGTLVYSAVDSVKVRKLNKLYNDLRQLDDAVGVYYLQNNELPVDDSKGTITVTKGETRENLKNKNIAFVLKSNVDTVANQNSFMNPNDYVYDAVSGDGDATYQYLKLSLLGNLSLNYGSDDFIINTQSHTIYYYTGLTIDGKAYYSLPLTYRDTKYNETHQVSAIRLRSVTGITNTSSTDKIVYFSYSTEKLNLRDLLIFDSSGTDGLGKPKEVTFAMKDNVASNYYDLNTTTGVLTRKGSFENVSESDATSQISIYANSYGNSPTVNLDITVQASSINIYTTASPSTEVKTVNLVTNQSQSTYKYMKTASGTAEYKVQKNGALYNPNPDMVAKADDKNVASATYNKDSKVIVFQSGTKTGSTNVTLEAQGYGLAKDTVKVNVFHFEIYAGSAGSNTNIDSLDFKGLGSSHKTNVKLNLEGPSGFVFDGTNNKVEWSIVQSDGTTADTSGVVSLTQDSDVTKATITPLKVGKTYLRCIVTIEGEKLEEMLIPITASGIVSADGKTVTDDTITITKDDTVLLKYSFADSSLADTVTYEEPTISPSTNFTITQNADKTYTVKYTGSDDVKAEVTIIAKSGDVKYQDTISIAVAN